ncbi:MAG: tetratricopeptide repeat protein [Chloroflexi bacterium]|nr:tetratricopeptide repeat protein [Chloroflexota bacterium]
MKDYFREVFRSDTEKRFDAACELARYGFDAAIPSLEEIISLEPQNPRFRGILAVFYAGAGDERLSHPMGFPGGPVEELRPKYSFFSGEIRPNKKAEEILSCVTEVRQSQGKQFHQYGYEELDKALNGSLAMFDKSLDMNPNDPHGYSGRASAYEQVAEGILMAYGIFPVRFWTRSDNESEWELVKYGNAQLGMCIKRLMPNLEFLTEIIWLYEQAEEEYKKALRLDPTDTRACVKLSHVLRQLGKNNEATDYVDKVLAILNKAILADNEDKQSYSERAEIFQELGKVELAIADLERLLTLSTRQFEIDSTRRKIEELRKGKVT